jgi:hypothetical protein
MNPNINPSSSITPFITDEKDTINDLKTAKVFKLK